MGHSNSKYRVFYAKIRILRGLSGTLISSVEVTSWFDSVFIRLACWINESPRGKTNNVVFEQVRHKPVCAVTDLEAG